MSHNAKSYISAPLRQFLGIINSCPIPCSLSRICDMPCSNFKSLPNPIKISSPEQKYSIILIDDCYNYFLQRSSAQRITISSEGRILL